MFRKVNRRDYQNNYSSRPIPKVPGPKDAPRITGDLNQTIEQLKRTSGRSDDFVVRYTEVHRRRLALAYYSSTIDTVVVRSVLRALQQTEVPGRLSRKEFPDYLAHHVLPEGTVSLKQNVWQVREALSHGDLVILIDGALVAIACGAFDVPSRTPQEPILESSTRGPQISFVENIETNIGLLRRALASDSLTIKELVVGSRSRTRVMLVYEYDVANPELVQTLTKRIAAVHVDKITGGATLEQRIVDNHWTYFPLTRSTTRLDNCVKEVGQGKVLVLVDGDPTAFLAPAGILDFFQTMEDDQHSYFEATFVRLLRLFSAVLALYLPALYVAFTDFNPELMPHILALQIARSREGVPFNAAVEVIIMQTVIEIIREATLRMPKAMGQTIGIVGGLVLGEASVQAGLVSNILIVIIALTAVSQFVLPSYEFSTVLRISSWLNVMAASMFGVYGVLLVSLSLTYHIASLKSFGMSYITPLGGQFWKDALKDGIIRLPIPLLDRRAQHLRTQESTRGADYTDPVRHPMLERRRERKKAAEKGRGQR